MKGKWIYRTFNKIHRLPSKKWVWLLPKTRAYFSNFYFLPRLWFNECDNPNFQHKSVVVRWAKFYYGYQYY